MNKKTAIIHDFLYWDGGAERCLRAMRDIFPEARIFSLFYARQRLPAFSDWNISTTWLDRVPFVKSHHYLFFPLYPFALSTFDMSGYEVVISNSWAWSKNVVVPGGACHICYCYTPMRFAYELSSEYMRRRDRFSKLILSQIVAMLRRWDLRKASGVTHYIAISDCVRQRIEKHYGRSSVIVHPPVDTDFFVPPPPRDRGDFYLVVSRLVPYKRIDIVIEAFNDLKKPLKIAGEGMEEEYLRRIAGPHIEFIGRVTDRELLSLYQRGKALVFPQVEDFGLVPVEAQACGMPVLAFGEGGALETVREGETGHFFAVQSPQSLAAGVREMESMAFDTDLLRSQSLKFSVDRFTSRFKEAVEACVSSSP
jgi:glycosyltransferase involved in cell wall biosynthesis